MHIQACMCIIPALIFLAFVMPFVPFFLLIQWVYLFILQTAGFVKPEFASVSSPAGGFPVPSGAKPLRR